VHISEGILTGPVLLAGGGLAAAGLGAGLHRLDPDRIPRVGLLSAAFFVASAIHIPVGPSNVHLLLGGLAGILLGWAAVPSLFVALVLQALLFQFGGFTTLGVNTVIMALPAVLCFYAFKPFSRSERRAVLFLGALLCGALAVLGSGLLMCLALALSGEAFFTISRVVVVAHLPVMVVEGFVTAWAVAFLKSVKPEVLQCA
jgi:cobalt/nickel transport system permease protein